jgi:hypothetical protein
MHIIAGTNKAVVRRKIDSAYNVSEKDRTSVFMVEVKVEAAGFSDILVTT